MSKVSLKVTQASLNQTALDWSRNMTNIYGAINEAVRQKSDILALEELALTGYEANDEFQRVDNDRVLQSLDDIALYAQSLDPHLIISIGHPWRLQMRDVDAPKDAPFERVKNPLYDRMNLPFNVQSIISGGEILGMTAKSNLFNDERGYEKRYFSEWSSVEANKAGGVYGTINVPLDEEGERTVPFGRPIIQFHNHNKAFNLAQAICEEKWVATKYDGSLGDDSRFEEDNIIPSISRQLEAKDGLVLVVANASPPARDKIDKHTHIDGLLSQYADVVIDTDGLGSSGSTFSQFGHRIVMQKGETLSYGSRMNFAREAYTTSLVQIERAPDITAQNVHAQVERQFADHENDVQNTLAYETSKDAWDAPTNSNRHFEEIIRYTAFWLFDYMRKTGSKGIMEALSGGADSCFNSTMVAVMVNMGIKELGVEQFGKELNLKNTKELVSVFETQGEKAAIDTCMETFLTGVYMGTNNSSNETRYAAEFLMKGGDGVEGIGGKFLNRNVQDLLDFYGIMYAVEDTTKIDPTVKNQMITDIAQHLNMSPYASTDEERKQSELKLKQRYPEINDLATAADGVAYENIQARGREVLIMLFANKEGKMAVANPNLDEARNAYATYGGDLHSGTINLNAHLPKAYQLEIMRYMFENGVQGVMPPIQALGPVLKNKPTAELQPKNEEGVVVQNDEDAMQRSFAQMNKISEFMLYAKKITKQGERRLNACEVFEECKGDALFETVNENDLYNMVRVSYNRWTIAQHKIHASPIAPTFGRNVDHQTSQRTPNFHGQSKDELTQLGIQLMFQWAETEKLGWKETDKAILDRRAWQDEQFAKSFESGIRSDVPGKDFDLKKLYTQVAKEGWDKVFEPLPAQHPIIKIAQLKR